MTHQTPLFIPINFPVFPRQEYWSGLAFPSENLPDPGIKHVSPALQALSHWFEITSQVRGSDRFGLCHIFRALLFSDFSNSELLLLFAWGECRSSVSLFVFVCFFMFCYPFSYSYPLTSQRERASLRVLAHSPAAEYWCLFLDTWLVIGLGCSVPYFPSSIFDRLCL